jgi:hypothetical protein
MGKQLTLRVAAPPLVLVAMLLLSFPFTGHCAVAEQPGADESSLDTGVAGDVVGPNFTESAASFGQSGVARATWYGAPNGAGPYDNGTRASVFLRSSTSWLCTLLLLCFAWLEVGY